MFSSAEAELNAFKEFDAPDLYYQYYPDEQYKGKKGIKEIILLNLCCFELYE